MVRAAAPIAVELDSLGGEQRRSKPEMDQYLSSDVTVTPVLCSIPSGTSMCLHVAHSGITKMYKTARQLCYWQGMKADIQSKLSSCKMCQAHLPSQARLPLQHVSPSAALGPMHSVGMDFPTNQKRVFGNKPRSENGHFAFCRKENLLKKSGVNRECFWDFSDTLLFPNLIPI